MENQPIKAYADPQDTLNRGFWPLSPLIRDRLKKVIIVGKFVDRFDPGKFITRLRKLINKFSTKFAFCLLTFLMFSYNSVYT